MIPPKSAPEPRQSVILSVLYVLYFAPLIWVLAEYRDYPVAAPAVVVGVTSAHFVAGLLETWGDLAGGTLERYLGESMWMNIVSDILITSSFVLSLICVINPDAPENTLLASAIVAVAGNILCVAGRARKICK